MGPIYRTVSETELFLKNPNFYKECVSLLSFLPLAISQFLIAAICFVIGWKELKPAQTAQINQLSLSIICIYGEVFYGLALRMLISKTMTSARIRLLAISI